jgi:hypothetical protein
MMKISTERCRCENGDGRIVVATQFLKHDLAYMSGLVPKV